MKIKIEDKIFTNKLRKILQDEDTKKLINDIVQDQINKNLIACEHGLDCSHLPIMQIKKLLDLIDKNIWTNLIVDKAIFSMTCNSDGSCKDQDITNLALITLTNRLNELYPKLTKELLIYQYKNR